MAGFVPSPNTIRVLVHWTWDGRPQLNVLHAEYSLAGPLNPNVADTVFTSARAAFVAAAGMGSLCSPKLVLSGIGILDIRGPNIPEISSTGTTAPGTGTGIALPEQISAVVTLRTAFTGRSFRGRVYLFGWAQEAQAADGSISDGTEAAAIGFVGAIHSGLASISAQTAIRSPAKPERPSKPGGTLPATLYAITPVTRIEMRDRIWDTNRRRQDLLRR